MRRRLLSILLVGAAALSVTAFAPSVETDAERQIVVCVRFRDTVIPVTGTTIEKPSDRFCVETRDVTVPFPGGNPAPGTIPGQRL